LAALRAVVFSEDVSFADLPDLAFGFALFQGFRLAVAIRA
jgi:hypothetical protein